MIETTLGFEIDGTKGGEPKTNDQFCQRKQGNLTGLRAKTGLFARFIFVFHSEKRQSSKIEVLNSLKVLFSNRINLIKVRVPNGSNLRYTLLLQKINSLSERNIFFNINCKIIIGKNSKVYNEIILFTGSKPNTKTKVNFQNTEILKFQC